MNFVYVALRWHTDIDLLRVYNGGNIQKFINMDTVLHLEVC